MNSVHIAKEVFQKQSDALMKVSGRLDKNFDAAIDLILKTKGKVIITGIGKSGIIGRKIAATLASTGTPSFFVHPAEAYHGDLGMLTEADTVILISNSGETDEIIRLIPSLKLLSSKTIAITGDLNSTLSKNVDISIDISIDEETCPHNLAPTTSTTATLVMGDAIAITLMIKRDFKPVDFAIFHPGGSLGKKLLTPVKSIMHLLFPTNNKDDKINSVIENITNGRLGATIIESNKRPLGIITDGDIRRAIKPNQKLDDLCAADIMNSPPATIREESSIHDAEKLMLSKNINCLIVVTESNETSGFLRLLDIK